MSDAQNRYRTRSKANTAQRIPLYDPATKTTTEDWLEVKSAMSDDFRRAKDVAMREAGLLADEPAGPEKDAASDAVKFRMYASLVAAWSFDTPCTPEAVAEFLADSPHVTALVVGIADRSELFFGGGSDS